MGFSFVSWIVMMSIFVLSVRFFSSCIVVVSPLMFICIIVMVFLEFICCWVLLLLIECFNCSLVHCMVLPVLLSLIRHLLMDKSCQLDLTTHTKQFEGRCSIIFWKLLLLSLPEEYHANQQELFKD